MERGDSYVVYESPSERWRIDGVCICCGECEVGSLNPHIVWTGIAVGEPGAAFDDRGMNRLDDPVRPEIAKHPHCTLRGRYL